MSLETFIHKIDEEITLYVNSSSQKEGLYKSIEEYSKNIDPENKIDLLDS